MEKCVSKIKDKATGTCYDIKDCVAREGVANLETAIENLSIPEDIVINSNTGIDKIKSGLYAGSLRVVPADNSNIEGRVPKAEASSMVTPNTSKPITPATLDYAIKMALTSEPVTPSDGYTGYQWTEDEKAKAREFLGISDNTDSTDSTGGKVYGHWVILDNDGTMDTQVSFTTYSSKATITVDDIFKSGVYFEGTEVVNFSHCQLSYLEVDGSDCLVADYNGGSFLYKKDTVNVTIRSFEI